MIFYFDDQYLPMTYEHSSPRVRYCCSHHVSRLPNDLLWNRHEKFKKKPLKYKQFVRMNFIDDSSRILHYKVLRDNHKMSILAFPHRETGHQPFDLHGLLSTQNTKTPAILHSGIKLYAQMGLCKKPLQKSADTMLMKHH